MSKHTDETPGKTATGDALKEKESLLKGTPGKTATGDARKEAETLLKGSEDRAGSEGEAKGKGPMSEAAFLTGVDAAYASDYREQEMRAELAKGVTEQARLAKELASISDELGMVNGPPRRGHRSEVPRERSEIPRQRGNDDVYDHKFPRRKTDESRHGGGPGGSRRRDDDDGHEGGC